MWHFWGREVVHTEFCCGNLEVTEHSVDLDVDWRIMLKRNLKNVGWNKEDWEDFSQEGKK
jgi:hypothetical protein